MKALLLLVLFAGVLSAPAFAQISDKTGLNSRLTVDAGGQDFEVLVTGNFDVPNATFDLEQMTLNLEINSSVQENLGEMTIPRVLLDGDISVLHNDEPLDSNIRSNSMIWFITIEFIGDGMHTIKVVGTESVGIAKNNTNESSQNNIDEPPHNTKQPNGCLIATATYGTELAPQVQMLRDIRDNTILETSSGLAFMTGFNQIYYVFSPTISDWERQNSIFREGVKIALGPLLATLPILDGVDSEFDMITHGVGVIALNIGIYFGPIVGLVYGVRLYKIAQNYSMNEDHSMIKD